LLIPLPMKTLNQWKSLDSPSNGGSSVFAQQWNDYQDSLVITGESLVLIFCAMDW